MEIIRIGGAYPAFSNTPLMATMSIHYVMRSKRSSGDIDRALMFDFAVNEMTSRQEALKQQSVNRASSLELF